MTICRVKNCTHQITDQNTLVGTTAGHQGKCGCHTAKHMRTQTKLAWNRHDDWLATVAMIERRIGTLNGLEERKAQIEKAMTTLTNSMNTAMALWEHLEEECNAQGQ